jgi:hypothetical protein
MLALSMANNYWKVGLERMREDSSPPPGLHFIEDELDELFQ